jgi:hypothetical protein
VRLEVRNLSSSNLCANELSLLSAFDDYLSGQIIDKTSVSPPSVQVKVIVKSFFRTQGWHQKFLFDGTIPNSINRANYTLDGIKDDPETSQCPHRHRTFVELCFDNRQAIGTNLLKFQVAVAKFEEKEATRGLPLLICADRRSLREFGWDNSAASSEEYEFAIRNPYRAFIARPPVLLVIRD